jgi:transcriptional regulator with XRE-family HTH domain
VLDLNRLKKFERKSYRDGYLFTQVRSAIAHQIQALRAKFRLTQAEFAERTQKKQSTISRLESTQYGKVRVQTLLDIASSMDVALLVQFVSYPEFLRRTSDMSEAALQPQTIFETLAAPPIQRSDLRLRLQLWGSREANKQVEWPIYLNQTPPPAQGSDVNPFEGMLQGTRH